MRPDAAQLRHILASGILAPSAENKHYLRFKILDDSVQLCSTDQSTWVGRRHRHMLAFMSYGAVVENIALCSAELGFTMVVRWLPDGLAGLPIADLRWTEAAAAHDPLKAAIESRHTNRRFYRRAMVHPQTLARVSDAASVVPGAALIWLDDPTSRALALKAIRIAETERFRRQALHAELFDSIRFEIGWTKTCDEWLPPAALQVEPPMRKLFALMRHWGVMQAGNRIGAHIALGLRAGYLPCKMAPHLGLIAVKGHGEELGSLQAGRAFERVWLAAENENLALQPMAAATALVRQTPGNGWVSVEVKNELQRLLDSLCGAGGGRPYMLFRLGQAQRPDAVTGRMPLDRYLD